MDLDALKAQRAALDIQIAEQEKAAKSGNVERVKALMSELGVTLDDLTPKRRASSKGVAVAIQYRDGNNTWTGRGLKPKWLQSRLAEGRSLDEFKVA